MLPGHLQLGERGDRNLRRGAGHPAKPNKSKTLSAVGRVILHNERTNESQLVHGGITILRHSCQNEFSLKILKKVFFSKLLSFISARQRRRILTNHKNNYVDSLHFSIRCSFFHSFKCKFFLLRLALGFACNVLRRRTLPKLYFAIP